MHYDVQQQQHKSNYWHYHTAVYMQLTQLHAHHQHAEQWSSHHTIRFRPDTSGDIRIWQDLKFWIWYSCI